GQVDGVARTGHRHRQVRRLRRRHAPEEDGHRPRGHLVVGYAAPGVFFHDEVDLLPRQLFAIAFFRDQVDHSHVPVTPLMTALSKATNFGRVSSATRTTCSWVSGSK